MNKIAKAFVKEDGQDVWSYDTSNGETYNTVGIDVTEEGYSLVDGVPRITVERNIVWVGANDVALLKRQQQAMIDAVNSGKLRAYRAYSETPFYEGQEQDINPSTQENLGRYSQARMCTPEDYLRVHRQFVVNTPKVVEPVAQPKVGADVEQA